MAASAMEARELLHGRCFGFVLMDTSLKGDAYGLSLTRCLRSEEKAFSFVVQKGVQNSIR
jgi:hypothetical protein